MNTVLTANRFPIPPSHEDGDGAIRARLDAGADPNSGVFYHGRPLHAAAENG
ncbi:hypothetical protein [Sphaerisporangium album]|uniref:hypothetical protein n=1 Tax=Sphaerisporangium album TaxID=509200 RepID=UPI0015F0F312|nr:hypothetical protein [Sphaerisporangium album]